jgi:DNA-binding IclR family transcriptional regulator
MLGCRSTQPEAYMLNLDQFMNIRFLQKQGHGVREIARLTGHSRNTVRKLLGV